MQRKLKTLAAILLFLSFAVLAIGCGKSEPLVTRDADLIIHKSEVTKDARFYPVEIDGVKMEVIAVLASDNTVRTAFNTCQVCFDSGRGYYVQEGDKLVCQNCGNKFRMDDLEVVRGGCNPVPITSEHKTETDTKITITKETLSLAKEHFTKWKK